MNSHPAMSRSLSLQRLKDKRDTSRCRDHSRDNRSPVLCGGAALPAVRNSLGKTTLFVNLVFTEVQLYPNRVALYSWVDFPKELRTAGSAAPPHNSGDLLFRLRSRHRDGSRLSFNPWSENECDIAGRLSTRARNRMLYVVTRHQGCLILILQWNDGRTLTFKMLWPGNLFKAMC